MSLIYSIRYQVTEWNLTPESISENHDSGVVVVDNSIYSNRSQLGFH